MDYNEIITEFKNILLERFPSGYNYIPRLSEILSVHPKTIQRKLSGETQFTLEETIKISQALDLSIHKLFNGGVQPLKHPMEIYLHDFSKKLEYQLAIKETLNAFTFACQSEK